MVLMALNPKALNGPLWLAHVSMLAFIFAGLSFYQPRPKSPQAGRFLQFLRGSGSAHPWVFNICLIWDNFPGDFEQVRIDFGQAFLAFLD